MAAFQKRVVRHSLLRTLLRSVRSTAVIALVLFAIIEIGSARLQLVDFTELVTRYWELFLGIFLALTIWDYWLGRVRGQNSLAKRGAKS